MKRIFGIVIACMLLLTGCTNSYKDINVTSFRVVSVTPEGMSALSALVEVGIDNPIVGFVVTDLKGTVKMSGKPCITLSADQLIVDGKTEKVYSIPVKGRLEDGFNPFQLLTLMTTADKSNVTADISFHVALKNGIGMSKTLTDVALDKLLDKI